MGISARSYPRSSLHRRTPQGRHGRVCLAQSWYNNLRPTIGRARKRPFPRLDYELWQPAPRRRSTRLSPLQLALVLHWGNGELGNNGIHMDRPVPLALNADYPIHVTSSGPLSYETTRKLPIHTSSTSSSRAASRSCGKACRAAGKRIAPTTYVPRERGTMTLSDSNYNDLQSAGKPMRRRKVQSGDSPHSAPPRAPSAAAPASTAKSRKPQETLLCISATSRTAPAEPCAAARRTASTRRQEAMAM